MAGVKRRGLTLAELIVVVIVVLLVLLLLPPFLLQSRTSRRRLMCMENQWQLSRALLEYESHHGYFPGYVNRLSPSPESEGVTASWVPVLFAYMDKADLWKRWQQGQAVPWYLEGMVCPSDPPRGSFGDRPLLSYVANCGRPGDEDTAAEGLFHNHSQPEEPVRVSLKYVRDHDGTGVTLLVAENVQAGFWTDTDEANVGMVWWRDPAMAIPINGRLDAGDRPQDIRFARPSSYHPGGFVASDCDGKQRFISQQIAYAVFQHLMTPDSAQAGLGPAGSAVLSETAGTAEARGGAAEPPDSPPLSH